MKFFNEDKLARAKKMAGADASEELVLINYLKLGGHVLDEKGIKIPHASWEEKLEAFNAKKVKAEEPKELKKGKK